MEEHNNRTHNLVVSQRC